MNFRRTRVFTWVLADVTAMCVHDLFSIRANDPKKKYTIRDIHELCCVFILKTVQITNDFVNMRSKSRYYAKQLGPAHNTIAPENLHFFEFISLCASIPTIFFSRREKESDRREKT